MAKPRWLLLVLVLLLAFLQYHLWFGRGSSGEVITMRAQVASQARENEGLHQRNAALAAEVEDLKSGEAAVEERARSELGMIKPGEKFYRVVDVPEGQAGAALPPVPQAPQEPTDAEAAAAAEGN
ncbi:cell division protein FtsB [Pseudoxanthomonas sp.]|uniref:cell division protein FtsB n=1 Tax=Pseudoxanthomonas sp. TaxID=1871049 RepID=UPI00261C428C|nr:cell division protein FtsB [Pseudoxanthomonas sp.]WDS37248.1 MAG: cell division protein FtsB [Pseudoxanthomonas sp.]